MNQKPFLPRLALLLLCVSLLMPALFPPQSDALSLETRSTEVHEVNGHVWLDADNEGKLNFLLGVENVIAMEYALAYVQAEQEDTSPVLSKFQRGWTSAFENTSRQQIVDQLNRYYRANPSARNRHVFDIIWTEMIVPVLPRR